MMPNNKAANPIEEQAPRCPNAKDCGGAGELFLAVAPKGGPEVWQCSGGCETSPAFVRDGEGFVPVKEAEKSNISKFFRIIKTDDAKRLAIGWASQIRRDGRDVIDLQGDMISPEELRRGAHGFMQRGGQLKMMHEGESVGQVVESFLATSESLEKLGLAADAAETIPTGWWVVAKISSDEVWAQVRDGTLKGFSIGGVARRRELQKANTDASPTAVYELLDVEVFELSVVTDPANQHANVVMTKAQMPETLGDAQERNRILTHHLGEMKKILAKAKEKPAVVVEKTTSHFDTEDDMGSAQQIRKAAARGEPFSKSAALAAIEELANDEYRRDGKLTHESAMNKVWAQRLNPFRGVGAANPTWADVWRSAPDDEHPAEVTKEANDLKAEQATLIEFVQNAIKSVQKRRPDWSPLKCSDEAYRDDKVIRAYRKYCEAGRKLEKLERAQ